MEHLDPDQIVLLALNERTEQGRQNDVRALSALDESSRQHLQECVPCRNELLGLTRTVELARSAGELGATGPSVLPASIWTGIATELGIGADPGQSDPAPRRDRPLDSVPAQWGPAPVIESPSRSESTTVRRRASSGGSTRPGGRRTLSWRRGLLVAAVVVAAAAGTAAGIAIGQRNDSAIAAVEYQAELKPMPAGPVDGRATATVVQADGSQRLKVSAQQLPLRQGYYEVWLYNPTADKMVAVGTLGAAGDGEFTLASTIDLRSYSVVDVSAQDFDGNAAHKTSVLQGPLTQ